uniref:Uncharacterized protein n=1 Tax=Anopheles albimanus TaxID=7167 RepID=A0A182FZH5_ANOAL
NKSSTISSLDVRFSLGLGRGTICVGRFERRYVLAEPAEHNLPVAVQHDAQDGDGKQHAGQNLVIVLQPVVVLLDTDQGAKETAEAKVRYHRQCLGESGHLTGQQIAEVQHQRDPVQYGEQDETEHQRQEGGHQDLARTEGLDDAPGVDEHRNRQQIAGEQNRTDEGMEQVGGSLRTSRHLTIRIVAIVAIRDAQHMGLIDRINHTPHRSETDRHQEGQPAALEVLADGRYREELLGRRPELPPLFGRRQIHLQRAEQNDGGRRVEDHEQHVRLLVVIVEEDDPTDGTPHQLTAKVGHTSRGIAGRHYDGCVEQPTLVALVPFTVLIKSGRQLNAALSVGMAHLILLVRVRTDDRRRYDHRLLVVRYAIVIVILIVTVRDAIVIIITVLIVRDTIVVVVRILIIRDAVPVEIVLATLALIVHIQYPVIVIIHILRVRYAIVIIVIILRVRDAIVVIVRILIIRYTVTIQIVRHRFALQRIRYTIVIIIQIFGIRNTIVVIIVVLRIRDAIVIIVLILGIWNAVTVQIVRVGAILPIRYPIIIVITVLVIRNAIVIIIVVLRIRYTVIVIVRVLIVRYTVAIQIVELRLALLRIRDTIVIIVDILLRIRYAIVVIVQIGRIRYAIIVIVLIFRIRYPIIIIVVIQLIRDAITIEIIGQGFPFQCIRNAIIVIVRILRIRNPIIIIILILRIRYPIIVIVIVQLVRDAITVEIVGPCLALERIRYTIVIIIHILIV